MPYKDPAARKRNTAAWYAANRDKHRARSATRYKAQRQLRLQQVARWKATAAGMLATVRANAKRRQA